MTPQNTLAAINAELRRRAIAAELTRHRVEAEDHAARERGRLHVELLRRLRVGEATGDLVEKIVGLARQGW